MSVADGVVTGLLLDLDGLRGREPAAAEILRQRQGVIEQAAHPIILSDAEGRITGCNSAAESLFGSGWADAGGSDLATAVLAPADRAAYRDIVAGLLAQTDESAAPVPLRAGIRRCDGSPLGSERRRGGEGGGSA